MRMLVANNAKLLGPSAEHLVLLNNPGGVKKLWHKPGVIPLVCTVAEHACQGPTMGVVDGEGHFS